MTRVIVKDRWDVFPRKGVGGIRDKETGLCLISFVLCSHQEQRKLTFPIAPSPTTTPIVARDSHRASAGMRQQEIEERAGDKRAGGEAERKAKRDAN